MTLSGSAARGGFWRIAAARGGSVRARETAGPPMAGARSSASIGGAARGPAGRTEPAGGVRRAAGNGGSAPARRAPPVRRRPRRGRGSAASASAGAADDTGAGVTIELPTASARREIVLEKHKEWHYVSAVATGSEAEQKGVSPGMVLRAVSDPVTVGSMWRVRETDGERTISSASLRNVRDAIASTRQYDIRLEFEDSFEVTAEMVTAEQAQGAEERGAGAAAVPARPTIAEQLQAQQQQQTTKTPASERVDRPDLYSDNWNGDEYVGSGFNELTVIVGLAVGVPAIGLAIALLGRGTLWDVSPY